MKAASIEVKPYSWNEFLHMVSFKYHKLPVSDIHPSLDCYLTCRKLDLSGVEMIVRRVRRIRFM